MHKEIMAALIAQLETAVGCSFVKGLPAWRRDSLTPPVGSVLLVEAALSTPARVGGGPQRHSATWHVYVFGEHEPGMLDMVEDVIEWIQDTLQLTVNGKKVDMIAQNGLRHDNVSGTQQESYGFYIPIITIW